MTDPGTPGHCAGMKTAPPAGLPLGRSFAAMSLGFIASMLSACGSVSDAPAETSRTASADASWVDTSAPDTSAPRRRPGIFWQRSRDGVLLIIGVQVTAADPCRRGCRVGSPIPKGR